MRHVIPNNITESCFYCGFEICQTSSAILRNKCFRVGPKLPRKERRVARRWLDQWSLQNTYIYCFCWGDFLESRKVNAWEFQGKPRFITETELCREGTDTAKVRTISVSAHDGFLPLSNETSCMQSLPGAERQKSYQTVQDNLFYNTDLNYPILQNRVVACNFYKVEN